MKVVLVVTFKVKEDQTAPFEALVTGLAKQVLANEPGARMYQLCRAQNAPGTYRLIEVYEDAAALAAHGQSEHYKAAAPKFAPCLAERPTIERYETVDG